MVDHLAHKTFRKNQRRVQWQYRRMLNNCTTRGRMKRKTPFDRAELNTAIDKVHRAGMPGVFAEVRDGNQVWRGAAGVADVNTGHPVTPEMRHRVGSITKTFTAAAVLQQVESGQIRLDTPIGQYLPQLVPG